MRFKLSVATYLLFGCVVLALTGCRKDKPVQSNSNLTDYELVMTNEDTLAVTNLVNTFFNYIEHDQLADAVAMLYKMNEDDVFEEPQLLDNDQIAKVMAAYKSLLPIRGHRIDYIKFHDTYNNEVKVTAILEEATEDRPEVTTVIYFKLYDYLSMWRLCTFNSDDGNRRIISNEQADSLQSQFAERQNSKSDSI